MKFANFLRLSAKRLRVTVTFVLMVSFLWTLNGCSILDRSPSSSDAEVFFDRADELLSEFGANERRAAWVRDSYPSMDTIELEARATSELLRVGRELGIETLAFRESDLPEFLQRKMELLRSGFSVASHSDPVKQQEFVERRRQLDEFYRTREFCLGDSAECVDEQAIEKAFVESDNTDHRVTLWRELRRELSSIRDIFERSVELTNEAAIEFGYGDSREAMVSFSGMTVEDFQFEQDRLWNQVRPLYESLHCLVRSELGQQYGTAVVPPDEEIPAHLLDDVANQSSISLHKLLSLPDRQIDDVLARSLQRKEINSVDIVNHGRKFFNSLGLEPLQSTFWNQSIFVSPTNEENHCAVRAWNVDLASDVRLKVCPRITGEDFIGIYRSLGEIYYHRATNAQDVLFRIGDQSELLAALSGAVTLSLTPDHLDDLGLLPDADLDESRIAFLLKQALDTIGGAPFGLVVDTWRSLVLSGEIGADSYNTAWWDLRRKYEGIRPAVPRSATDFDPGSDRDVLIEQTIGSDLFSEVLKFQIHRDLCRASGFEGTLSECSIYRSSEAGLRLTEMMTIEAGATRQRLLYLLTGAHQLNAGALLEYFLPLSEWLQTKNEGQSCGW